MKKKANERQPERRLIDSNRKIELRIDGEEENASPVIVHHAPPWDFLSAPLWYERRGEKRKAVRERFTKGAFGELVSGDVRGLFNHDSSQLIGRTTSRTLLLEEDDIGLRYEISLPSTQLGQDLRTLIERGDLSGSSFAFWPGNEEWEETDDEIIRTITGTEALYDVGPVTYPAYPFDGMDLRASGHCSGAARSFESWISESSAVSAEVLLEMRRKQKLLELLA